MAYVDTNVLISYYFDEEELHEVSTRIFQHVEDYAEEDIHLPVDAS